MNPAYDHLEPSPKPKPSRGCVVFIVGVLLVCLVPGLIGHFRNNSESITLRATVIISNPAEIGIPSSNCRTSADFVIINAVSHGAEKIELTSGTSHTDGSCTFSFTAKVPVADTYVFSMPGTTLQPWTFKRSLIDVNGPTGVELEVTLRW